MLHMGDALETAISICLFETRVTRAPCHTFSDCDWTVSPHCTHVGVIPPRVVRTLALQGITCTAREMLSWQSVLRGVNRQWRQVTDALCSIEVVDSSGAVRLTRAMRVHARRNCVNIVMSFSAACSVPEVHATTRLRAPQMARRAPHHAGTVWLGAMDWVTNSLMRLCTWGADCHEFCMHCARCQVHCACQFDTPRDTSHDVALKCFVARLGDLVGAAQPSVALGLPRLSPTSSPTVAVLALGSKVQHRANMRWFVHRLDFSIEGVDVPCYEFHVTYSRFSNILVEECT